MPLGQVGSVTGGGRRKKVDGTLPYLLRAPNISDIAEQLNIVLSTHHTSRHAG